jgi:septal ring factor EnvC (AmiA/AmiB activator)
MDLFSSLITVVSSTVAYILVDYVWRFLSKRFWPRKQLQQNYSERLAKLTRSLTESSKEVDRVLRELAEVASNREASINKLESELSRLETKEQELKQRVDTLANIQLPVAEYFAKLVQKGEKRSATRDYALFGAGVVVSTSIAIILRMLGWA